MSAPILRGDRCLCVVYRISVEVDAAQHCSFGEQFHEEENYYASKRVDITSKVPGHASHALTYLEDVDLGRPETGGVSAVKYTIRSPDMVARPCNVCFGTSQPVHRYFILTQHHSSRGPLKEKARRVANLPRPKSMSLMSTWIASSGKRSPQLMFVSSEIVLRVPSQSLQLAHASIKVSSGTFWRLPRVIARLPKWGSKQKRHVSELVLYMLSEIFPLCNKILPPCTIP